MFIRLHRWPWLLACAPQQAPLWGRSCSLAEEVSAWKHNSNLLKALLKPYEMLWHGSEQDINTQQPFQCVWIKAKQSGPKFIHRDVKRFRARTGDQVRVESYHPAAFKCIPSLTHLEKMNGWLGGFWRAELLLVRKVSLLTQAGWSRDAWRQPGILKAFIWFEGHLKFHINLNSFLKLGFQNPNFKSGTPIYSGCLIYSTNWNI